MARTERIDDNAVFYLLGQFSLRVAVASLLIFIIVSLGTSFTVVASYQEEFAGTGASLPAMTSAILGFHGLLRARLPFFVVGVLLFILILIRKESRVASPAVRSLVNMAAALVGVALVLVFVFGLPFALLLPVFRIGVLP